MLRIVSRAFKKKELHLTKIKVKQLFMPWDFSVPWTAPFCWTGPHGSQQVHQQVQCISLRFIHFCKGFFPQGLSIRFKTSVRVQYVPWVSPTQLVPKQAPPWLQCEDQDWARGSPVIPLSAFPLSLPSPRTKSDNAVSYPRNLKDVPCTEPIPLVAVCKIMTTI